MKSTINIDLLEGLSEDERLETRGKLLALHFMTFINHKIDQKGITKKELAKMVGTSPSYITQLFRGDKTPNWKMIAKMEKALGLFFKVECVGLATDKHQNTNTKLKSQSLHNKSNHSNPISEQSTLDYFVVNEPSNLSEK